MPSMPSDFEPFWDCIRNEVIWVHGEWEIYRSFFLKSERRVALLNGVDGALFGRFQAILFERTILGIARLTDPPKTLGKDNAVLRQFPRQRAIVADATLLVDVEKRLATIDAACEPIRERRNKAVAHLDLKYALAPQVNPLPGMTYSTIEEVLESIADLLNAVQLRLSNSSTAYSKGIWGLNADGVVEYLKAGLWCVTEEQELRLPWDYREKSPFRDA